MREVGGGQRHVVIVGALPGADAALPFRVGEVFVGGDFAIRHPALCGIDDARAAGQAEPVARRVAKFGRDRGIQHGRGNRLRHTRVDHLHQAGNIDRHHQIGRAAAAFRHQSFDHAGPDKGDVDRDAGFLGEGIEQRLHQFRLAVRIDVDLVGQRRKGGQQRGGKQGETHGHVVRLRKVDLRPINPRKLVRSIPDKITQLFSARIAESSASCAASHNSSARASPSTASTRFIVHLCNSLPICGA